VLDVTYGAMILPGAPFVPAWVWQVLQSPFVCGVAMTRSLLDPETTLAM
jgi:hypothetical protein